MKVGDRVVCILTFYPTPMYQEKVPVKGEIYTIREIVDYGWGKNLRLVEVINPPRLYAQAYGEVCFKLYGFRLLDDSFGENLIAELEEEINQEQVVPI